MFVKAFSWSRLTNPLRFIINGTDTDNNKIRIYVDDFVNHIYLKINNTDWPKTKKEQNILLTKLTDNLSEHGLDVTRVKVQSKKTFYGYIETICVKVYIKNTTYKLNITDKPIPYIIVEDDLNETVKLVTKQNLKFCDLSSHQHIRSNQFKFVQI